MNCQASWMSVSSVDCAFAMSSFASIASVVPRASITFAVSVIGLSASAPMSADGSFATSTSFLITSSIPSSWWSRPVHFSRTVPYRSSTSFRTWSMYSGSSFGSWPKTTVARNVCGDRSIRIFESPKSRRFIPTRERHDLADADLRDRHHALSLQVPGQLDLDVPSGQLPAVLDLERVLVPLADLQPRALDAQGQIRVAVLDEILDLHPDGDLGLFDQDVRHRHVAPAERGLRLVQGILRVPEFRAELLRVRNHRGDGVDAGLVLLDETFRAGFLDRGPGVGQAPMEAVDVPTLDGLPGRVQMGTRGHRGNVELLRLRHDLLEGPNLVHGTVHDLLPLRLQETFLEIPLESVHFLDVVRGSRFLRVRAVLVQFLRRKAQREPVLDQRGEGVHDGGEVLAACRVDLVGDALRVSVDFRIFARVH